MLTLHIIAMVSTTIGAIIKTILLFVNEQRFQKLQSTTKIPTVILLITGACAGIYMIITKFGGTIPPWLVIKLTLFVTGGLTVSFAEKRKNKAMLTVGTSLLILTWIEANVKMM